MRPRNIASVVSVIAAVVALAGLSGSVGSAQAPGAQQAPPQRIQIVVTQLKPDMLLTWEDLVKNELIPAQKKVNIPWRQTYGNGLAGMAFTRITVTPVTNYAQFDLPGVMQRAGSPNAAANYNAKIRPTIASQRSYIATLRQDLSIPGSGAPMPLLVVQTLHVLPGKGAEFTASMTQDYLPAYKKAGVKDFSVYATNMGSPGGEFTLVRPIAKYAELDQPGLLQRAGLAQEAIAKINARRDPLLAGGVETEVVQLLPELSYGMPSPRGTN